VLHFFYYFHKKRVGQCRGQSRWKIKIESIVLSWVASLYVTPPDIIFDNKNFIITKYFVEKYNLCNKGPNFKWNSKDLEDEEVEELFKKAISRNCYRYYHIDNKELITKVETLWMMLHQKNQVPCNRMINKAEAKGIIYEWKGKLVNWCVFVRWMIWDQLWSLQFLEA